MYIKVGISCVENFVSEINVMACFIAGDCSSHAMINLAGEIELPANKIDRAEKLPGIVYLPGQVIPGSRSCGSSISWEKHPPGNIYLPS